jgi:hypothetical protein
MLGLVLALATAGADDGGAARTEHGPAPAVIAAPFHPALAIRTDRPVVYKHTVLAGEAFISFDARHRTTARLALDVPIARDTLQLYGAPATVLPAGLGFYQSDPTGPATTHGYGRASASSAPLDIWCAPERRGADGASAPVCLVSQTGPQAMAGAQMVLVPVHPVGFPRVAPQNPIFVTTLSLTGGFGPNPTWTAADIDFGGSIRESIAVTGFSRGQVKLAVTLIITGGGAPDHVTTDSISAPIGDSGFALFGLADRESVLGVRPAPGGFDVGFAGPLGDALDGLPK